MTIAQMEKICQSKDNHFFDKENIEFWNSKIEVQPNEIGLFIDSIDDFYGDERLYCVRAFGTNGYIATVRDCKNGTHYFETLEQAKELMESITDTVGKDFGIPKAVDEKYGDEGVFSFTNKEGNSVKVIVFSFSDVRKLNCSPEISRKKSAEIER